MASIDESTFINSALDAGCGPEEINRRQPFSTKWVFSTYKKYIYKINTYIYLKVEIYTVVSPGRTFLSFDLNNHIPLPTSIMSVSSRIVDPGKVV